MIQITSDEFGIEVMRTIFEGLGAVALFFMGYVLNDLRSRVMRIEDKLIEKGN